MAFQADLPMISFKDITGRKRAAYFAAISSGLDRDYKPMERLFEKIVERALKSKRAEI